MALNSKKYENLILYICRGLGGVVDGKKKLAKLLYYADFDRFEYQESMENITGDRYYAWEMGPVPEHYMNIVNKLVAANKMHIGTRSIGDGYRDQELFEAVAEPDLSVFDDADKRIIERVIKKYGNLNGKQLEILTHKEAPWLGTEQNAVIAYELSLYRGTDFDDVLATA